MSNRKAKPRACCENFFIKNYKWQIILERKSLLPWLFKFTQALYPGLACIAYSILHVRNKILVVELLIASREAAKNTLKSSSVPHTYKNNTVSYADHPGRSGIWRCWSLSLCYMYKTCNLILNDVTMVVPFLFLCSKLFLGCTKAMSFSPFLHRCSSIACERQGTTSTFTSTAVSRPVPLGPSIPSIPLGPSSVPSLGSSLPLVPTVTSNSTAVSTSKTTTTTGRSSWKHLT